MTYTTLPRAVVEQALEAMRCAVPTGKITLYEWDKAMAALRAALAQQRLTDVQQEMERSIESLKAALAQQAEPGPGKVVAWGVFALADGEWQLQHPVFVGDECGKENAEFERASYSGPQPLEVRPLGVVTAPPQQAEPVEPVEPHRWEGDHNIESPFNACMHKHYCMTLKQAEQAEPVEPVAWMFELARNFNLEGYGGWEKRITEYRPNTPEGSVRNVTPLYTAPPQRKPLTGEEIKDCLPPDAVRLPPGWAQFARAVERKVRGEER